MMIYLQRDSWKYVKPTSSETGVYSYLKKNGESTTNKIITDLNLQRGNFKKLVKGLQRKGLVIRTGYGRYAIPNEENIIPFLNNCLLNASKIMSSNPEKYDRATIVDGIRIPEHSIRIEDLERL